jgi:outer membrane receptor protein involved in Fe transport
VGQLLLHAGEIRKEKTFVPLVPRHKASLGLEWQINDFFLLSFTGNAVSSRYDGNDENNDLYEKLEKYQVVDLKLTYTFKGIRLFAGVNNLFNQIFMHC